MSNTSIPGSSFPFLPTATTSTSDAPQEPPRERRVFNSLISGPRDLFERMKGAVTNGVSHLGDLKDKYLERPFANGKDGFVALAPDGSVAGGMGPGARIRDRDLPRMGQSLNHGAELLADGEKRKVAFTLPDGRVIQTETDDRGDKGIDPSALNGLGRGMDPQHGGLAKVGITTPNGDPSSANVLMLPANYDGPIFVSDIDDTLRQTDPKSLLLGRQQQPIPGAKETLEAVAKMGIPIVYLSAGANPIHAQNVDFLSQLPPGILLDRDRYGVADADPRNSSQVRNQGFYKQGVLGELSKTFPNAKLFGLGDDKYGDALAYTRQGAETYIHDVRPGNDNLPPDFTGTLVKDYDRSFIDKVTADLQRAVEQSASFGGTTKPEDPYAALSKKLDRVTRTRATEGNDIQLFVDGPNALPRILEGIDSAKKSVCYETFKLMNDEVGNRVADRLIAASNRGAKVRVIVDAAGSQLYPFKSNAVVDKLRAAGVDVRIYNPFDRLSDVTHFSRDHRKTVLVDGETAFVGGMNTANRYMGTPDSDLEWKHDLFSEFRGPAVENVANAFADSWKAAGGDPIPAEQLAGDRSPRPDGVKMRVVSHVPDNDSDIHAAYLSMINGAQKQLNVENCFPLTDDLADALCAAAQRGVNVRYVVPNTDDMVGVAIRKHFQRLVDAGVNVYVYPGNLHTKAMSVDGKMASVGSSNVDNTSLARNREIIALVEDPKWVADFDSRVFDQDVVGKPTGEKSKKVTQLDRNMFQQVSDRVIEELWPDTYE